MIVSSQAAHIFLPVAGPAQHLALGRTNRLPLLILPRMSIPSSYGGLYPPLSPALPSEPPEIPHGFLRRNRRTRRSRVATSLRLARQRTFDSDTILVMVASGIVPCAYDKPAAISALECSPEAVAMKRPGCSFRKAVAFLTGWTTTLLPS